MTNSSETHPATANHACSGGHRHDHSGHAASHAHGNAGMVANEAGARRVKDPVCGMTVDPHATEHRAEQHKGHQQQDPGSRHQHSVTVTGEAEPGGRDHEHRGRDPDDGAAPAGPASLAPANPAITLRIWPPSFAARPPSGRRWPRCSVRARVSA